MFTHPIESSCLHISPVRNFQLPVEWQKSQMYILIDVLIWPIFVYLYNTKHHIHVTTNVASVVVFKAKTRTQSSEIKQNWKKAKQNKTKRERRKEEQQTLNEIHINSGLITLSLLLLYMYFFGRWCASIAVV